MTKSTETMETRATKINQILSRRCATFTVQFKAFPTATGERRGFVIRDPKYTASPIVYEDSEIFGYSDYMMALELDKIHKRCMVSIPTENLLSKERVLSTVCPKVFNVKELGHVKQADYVYMKKLDLLVLFYIPIDIPDRPDESATSTLTVAAVESIGIGTEELYAAAVNNISHAGEVTSLYTALTAVMEPDLPFPEVETDPMPFPMMIVTNKSRMYGAGAICSQSLLDKAAKSMATTIMAVCPSSQHELICVPMGITDPDNMLRVVREVNSTIVAPEDWLSNDIYIYNRETGSITIYTQSEVEK